MSARAGELAIVLHTHMPYVEGGGRWPPGDLAPYLRDPEGFGTWPFGEEWLWEAIATSYLPLLRVLGEPGGVPLTVSLTPVLCDQLEQPGAIDRCLRFLREVRPESHRRDRAQLSGAGDAALLAELERSAADYERSACELETLLQRPGGLLAALGAHVSWTSAATHALLPLLATDAGAGVQVQTGIASHRRRFGAWGGGFWLPECGYAPWLDDPLEASGVHSTCVELTTLFGLGDARHLRPLVTDAGLVLWPIDRQAIELVWGRTGYPSAAEHRDHHALTAHHHRVWSNAGTPYERAAAAARAREQASDFVTRVRARVAGGGVCVFAVDTELLGHWWHEGSQWLAAVIEEARRQGLRLCTLDDALTRQEPVPAPASVSAAGSARGLSWGAGGDLRTWSGPAVADLAWQARRAEITLAALPGRPPERAVRELLALQSSDWAFMASGRLAGDYPRERARLHADALRAALAGSGPATPRLRGLAPDLTGWG